MSTTANFFQAKSIEVVFRGEDGDKEGEFRVVAIDQVAAGELVLVEHVVASLTQEGVAGALGVDGELYDELHPRRRGDVFPENVGDKMFFNMIYFEEQEQGQGQQEKEKEKGQGFYVLGRSLAKFNHGCNPNCCVAKIEDGIYGVWALRRIPAGEELLIDYIGGGGVAEHDQLRGLIGFGCGCERGDVEKNAKKTLVRTKLVAGWLGRADLECLLGGYKAGEVFAGVLDAQARAGAWAARIRFV